MIVCVCRKISDRDLVRHAHSGMDFDQIQFELGVATQCGRCEGCAREVIAQCHAMPGPPSASAFTESTRCNFSTPWVAA